MLKKRKNRSDLIIALEGIDGAGKSTLIKNLLADNYFKDKISLYSRTKKNKYMTKFFSSRFMQRHYMLQVPFYILLSYKNYLDFKKQKRAKFIIMDRCFLSNLCYYFPIALDIPIFFKFLSIFEINMIPDVVFILDVKAEIGQIRDGMQKELKWLERTRQTYLHVPNSRVGNGMKVYIIDEDLSIENKKDIILRYIKGMRKL